MSVASKVDHSDFSRVGPESLSGQYLRRFWHPVYRSCDLRSGQAVTRRLLGEDFTLYRGDSGQAYMIDARCAHRATQLSTGWVEGDCIRCFYHGWKYDASGQCVEQPAEDSSFAAKVSIRSYPTQECLGLIFAYLGEGEPPPLPHYPEFEGEGILEAEKPVVTDSRSTGRRASSDDHSSRQFQLLEPVAPTTDQERTVIYSDRVRARRAWVSALWALRVPQFPAARVARNCRRRPQRRRHS